MFILFACFLVSSDTKRWNSQVVQWAMCPPTMKQTQEAWARSLGWEDSLEEDMTIYPHILAWRIPWTEEPDCLQSKKSQRFRPDCIDSACRQNSNRYNLFSINGYQGICELFKSESESEVSQSCLTLCDPMDCSLPGSSVHGIFQARVLEWGAISFSRGSSQPRDPTWVSLIAGRHFTVWATREDC